MFAATTVGTNLSTTGTFTQTVGSATAARFQNAAGTVNVLVIDTTNTRVGIGAIPGTTFEVQGTASASYFLTGNTIQVGGFASVAYNRFGTVATTNSLSATNDVLINGKLEVDGNTFFDGLVGIGGATNTKFEVQGTASASYFLTGNTIQVGGFASVAYNRFGTVATTHSLSATNDVLVNGLFETDGNAFFDSKASISSNLQISGRFIADTAASNSFTGSLNVTKTFVVGATTASVSSGSGYVAEFIGQGTGTASFYFGGGTAATKGTCFQLKSDTGAWIYMRFVNGATTPTLSTKRCQQ